MGRSTRAARKPHRPCHHGNLRRGLLDEALATIRAEGVGGLTLREIGARLGVSRTALYRHFADKRALLTAVANPSHDRVMFGGFVDPKACEPELTAEAAGAFQALVDALAALQRDAAVRDDTVTVARFV
jgi:AcrR family transcriptional regulator